MSRAGSFRNRLAVRFAVAGFLLVTAVSVVTYIALRLALFQELDLTIQRLVSIEAAATADTPDETVHFHDQVFLTSGDPGSAAILSRYAQFWTVEGEAVLRTANLGSDDLPLPAPLRERVASSGAPELFAFEWNGQRFRSILYPLGLTGPQHAVHLLQVAASTDGVSRVLSRTLSLLGVLVAMGTLAAAGLGWWLAGHAVRPVVEIAQQAEAMRAGSPRHHLSSAADTEEFGRLVQVLNSMLSRIDDLLEGQRRFLADAGHGIRTPLTVLRGDLEVTLRKVRSTGEYEETLRQALSDLKTVSSLADDLIILARSAGENGRAEEESDEVQLATLLEGVAAKFAGVASGQAVTIRVDSDPEIKVGGDVPLLERALSNLLDNALKYGVPSGGEIELGAARTDSGAIEISVSDSGTGIPSEEEDRLFDRFYRGDRHRHTVDGSGLGLAIVRAVIEGRGGEVTALSSDAGATLRITLPQHHPNPDAGLGARRSS